VWSSDWPHINYYQPAHMPDDGELLKLLVRWMPDGALRKRVLADNPALLYDFGNRSMQSMQSMQS